ncbi:MAG: PEP-CTERM-box response regulator transcription factor [Desulfobacterales bacterium]|nr:PEP-CTERM-box response regulator transcription factor [Desulfobacterales bacterium]
MPKERLLIIEDEPSVAKQLKWSLEPTYDITVAAEPQKARELLGTGIFAVATLDLGLPPSPDTPQEGLKLLELLPVLAPYTKVIVITGHGEQDVAVQAVSLGALDFCAKPIDLKLLHIILGRAYHIQALESANKALQRHHDQESSLGGLIGVSSAMRSLFAVIRKVSANDFPILITGESGTGKEMAAHAIHALSPRSQNPLVIVNCGAIPENLLESELFGHEKGAFTGAVARKIGRFEQAHNGTVFLDEIGELPLSMQVKLLRCLQEGTIDRVGGDKTLYLNVRIVAATNKDLEAAVAQGKFREDLFFRLNVVQVKMPPLRERPEDVLVLAHHFLLKEARTLRLGRPSFSPAAIAALSAHDWPGNVRELLNCIRRALSVSRGQVITPGHLELEAAAMPERPAEKLMTLQEARDQAERHCVQQALLITGHNISQAAKLLATSRPTLHDLMKKHGIRG